MWKGEYGVSQSLPSITKSSLWPLNGSQVLQQIPQGHCNGGNHSAGEDGSLNPYK